MEAFILPLVSSLGAAAGAGALPLNAISWLGPVTVGPGAVGAAGLGALTALGQISSVASPLLGVAGALQSAATSKAQAKEFEREARERKVSAALEAERMRRAARLASSREAGLALEGGVLSGTTIDVLDQNSVAAELDALTVEYQGEQGYTSSMFQAGQARAGTGPLPILTQAMRGFADFDPLSLAPRGGMGTYA